MGWRNFDETITAEGHKVLFSGKDDKHEHGVGFLVGKDIVNTIMGRNPVSSRLITARLRAVPCNITVVQAYAPTSDCDDNETEQFYDQLQNVIDQTPKKDILVVQVDWNAKVGKGAYENWQGICEPLCNDDKNERGLRLLETETYTDLFGHHKASRRWTWHSPNGQQHHQIHYRLARKRFRPGVNIARSRYWK